MAVDGVDEAAALAPGCSVRLGAAASQEDLLRLLTEVRQIAWAFERSDQALTQLHAHLTAERCACIEDAS